MSQSHASDDASGPRFIERVFQVRRSELPVVGWSWLYIFAILSSYYVMRPIREQMGVSGGIENLPWLFTATLAAMILLNLPFGYLVNRLTRIRFIPITYRFFTANILLFALALHLADREQAVWIRSEERRVGKECRYRWSLYY